MFICTSIYFWSVSCSNKPLGTRWICIVRHWYVVLYWTQELLLERFFNSWSLVADLWAFSKIVILVTSLRDHIWAFIKHLQSPSIFTFLFSEWNFSQTGASPQLSPLKSAFEDGCSEGTNCLPRIAAILRISLVLHGWLVSLLLVPLFPFTKVRLKNLRSN